MNTSPTLSTLATALHKAQGVLKAASKDATNPHFRSKYADLQSIWDAARPALQAHGLSVAQTFVQGDGEAVTIETTLLHTSGEWISSALTLRATKADPQGIGSAITYGRRYGLSSILGIVADEDDDGNEASVPTPAHTRAAQPPPAKPYEATGPKIGEATKTAILKLTEDPATLARCDAVLTAKKVGVLSDLSEDDAQKLLTYLQTKPGSK